MSPWLFSPRVDGAVFFGATALAALLALAARLMGVDQLGPIGFLLLVVGIDVAHVWSTAVRTYADGQALRRHPLRCLATPLSVYAVGVALHQQSSALFWRVLAYVAVWHFVRQQQGFMRLYARRAGSSVWRRRLDEAFVLTLTIGPVVWWHSRLPLGFWWFREHDFVPGLPVALGGLALVFIGVMSLVWLIAAATENRPQLPRLLFVASTALAWLGGIVFARDDVAFTALNVVAHGVPYLALTLRYGRGRLADGDAPAIRTLLVGGVISFMLVLVILAGLEEWLWDVLVWHDHPSLFGSSGLQLSEGVLALVVPALAVPQATHYVLDGLVWRGADDPALTRRLGWVSQT